MVELRLGHEISPQAELGRILAVNAADPGVQVMIDANESCNESQPMTYRRALEGTGIVWLEGPVSHHDVAGLTRLSQHLEVPITTGKPLFAVEPVIRMMESRAVNLVIDLARIDGITLWMKVAALPKPREFHWPRKLYLMPTCTCYRRCRTDTWWSRKLLG